MIDPVTLEVLWNRLLSVANEQQNALMRTAFSTIVRESQDLACAIFDARGYMIAQSLTGTPGHINPMATGAQHFLAVYPAHTLKPGDVLITNDPWQTAGQINDFTVFTPVFRGESVIAYFGNCCHAADVGGHVLSAEAHEVYEEGIRIPIMKLFEAGEPNHILLNIIRANNRMPDETIGDLYAQASCNAVGAKSLLHMMDEFQLESIEPLADEIIARSERALRNAIRALPNGEYKNEAWSDGFEQPIKLCVTVRIKDEEIQIDFAGSSPQSQRGINVVLNYTHGYASFAIKAAICPEVPHNEGAFRPVHVTAPRGSILNCVEPAAVASRHLVGHFLPGLIFGALAPVISDRILAGGADPIWLSVWRGRRLDESPFMFSFFQLGGTGARATKDGLNTTGFPSGVAGVPVEVVETLTALVQTRKALRPDSGGAGKFRGGLGQLSEFSCCTHQTWSVIPHIDRTRYAANGALGGNVGAMGELLVNGKVGAQPKATVTLQPDSKVQLNTPGGGGYGSPSQRDPQAVLSDVVNGYITIESAERDYGVKVRYTGAPDALVRLPNDYTLN
jgi:N-methylhydantoinase B